MPYERILVPIDGSEPAKAALAEAIRIARATGGELRLLHIIEEQIVYSVPEATILSDQLLTALREAGDDLLRDAVKQGADAGVVADWVKLEGRARRVSDLIVEQAGDWSADLIVMGTHGRRGLDRLVLGSDAETRGPRHPSALAVDSRGQVNAELTIASRADHGLCRCQRRRSTAHRRGARSEAITPNCHASLRQSQCCAF